MKYLTTTLLPGISLLFMAMILAGCEPASIPSGSAAATTTTFGDNRDDFDNSSSSDKTVELTSVDLAGHKRAVESQLGDVVLVEYWATWCAECSELLPHTIELGRQRKSDGLRVITVSMDTADDQQQALNFLAEHRAGLATNLRIDHEKFDAENLNPYDLTEQRLPYFKLFDRKGNLIATFIEDEATHENIERAVAEALKAE